MYHIGLDRGLLVFGPMLQTNSTLQHAACTQRLHTTSVAGDMHHCGMHNAYSTRMQGTPCTAQVFMFFFRHRPLLALGPDSGPEGVLGAEGLIGSRYPGCTGQVT